MSSIIKYIKSFSANRIPSQLVIQFTNQCNASCPQCGMRTSAGFKRSTLPKADLKRILDAAAAKGVASLSFTGGEPLLFLDNLIDWINYAGQVGIPFIRTGTNGYVFRHCERPDFEDRIKRLADRLVQTPLRNFWISLDSALPQVHQQMRGLSNVVAGIEKALPIFHAAGLYPSANLGINRKIAGDLTDQLCPADFTDQKAYLNAFYQCYREAFNRFYRFISELGFTIVNTCYPMSIDEQETALGLNAVYAATCADSIVRFCPAEKKMLFQALLDTIPRHRSHIRIFTPLSALYQLIRQYDTDCQEDAGFGCRGGVDFFFINAADGDTYPCGYRGLESMGKFWHLDLKGLKLNGDCRRCDWECFRDPSEFLAPFLRLLNRPQELIRQINQHPAFLKLWLQDMQYYRSNDFFDGRKPMP